MVVWNKMAKELHKQVWMLNVLLFWNIEADVFALSEDLEEQPLQPDTRVGWCTLHFQLRWFILSGAQFTTSKCQWLTLMNSLGFSFFNNRKLLKPAMKKAMQKWWAKRNVIFINIIKFGKQKRYWFPRTQYRRERAFVFISDFDIDRTTWTFLLSLQFSSQFSFRWGNFGAHQISS